MKISLLVESFPFTPSVILWTGSFVRIGAISPKGGVLHPLLSSALEITPSVALISNSDCMQMPCERSVILKGQRVCAQGGWAEAFLVPLSILLCLPADARAFTQRRYERRSQWSLKNTESSERSDYYLHLTCCRTRPAFALRVRNFLFLFLCFDHGLFSQKGVLLARLVICCCFCAFESTLSWKLFRKRAGKTRRRGEYSFNRDCGGDLEHGSSAQHLLLQGKTSRTRHSSNASKWKYKS